MSVIGFLTGAAIFAAISGFFALFASTFPSALLGSGSGLVLGIGRGGAVLGLCHNSPDDVLVLPKRLKDLRHVRTLNLGFCA